MRKSGFTMTAADNASNGSAPRYSVVVPFLNEEEVLPEFCRRIRATVEAGGDRWELVFVDDGSTDRSVEVLRESLAGFERFKVLRLSRNFGHQAAVCAGIDHASGEAVMVIDADLQDPPEVLSRFIQRWLEGAQVVYGVRRQRKESLVKRACYFLFYRLTSAISHIAIPLDAGDFCLMDRQVVDVIRRLPEKSRFVRGLRAWAGFHQEALEYERDARSAGEEKYTVTKLIRLALDGLLSFSHYPLRLATFVGAVASLLSFLEAIRIVYLKMTTDHFDHGIAALLVFVLFLGGMILLALGVIGEYIGRLYDEVKARPTYVVASTHDSDLDG